MIFVRNRTGGSFQLLVAGIRVNEEGLTVLEQCCECQLASYQNCEKQQNMEKGVNFAVPWKVQEPKSFQLQGGASPPDPHQGLRGSAPAPRPPDRLALRALAISLSEIPDFPPDAGMLE